MINYRSDMWHRCSKVLALLASLTSKVTPWKWMQVEQMAFEKAKKIISQETLLAYPDFNKPFEIHTYASDTQLGVVISQRGMHIAFYSCKLNNTHKNYTTTEQELLAIAETLKEFKNVLLGQQIRVYTDHKNLTYKSFITARVIRWCMVLEDYAPDLSYMPSNMNVAADSLSCLDQDNSSQLSNSNNKLFLITKVLITNDIENFNKNKILFCSEKPADAMIAECYIDKGETAVPPHVYPLSFKMLQKEQQKDKALLEALK
eukprot:5551272-Ditylum_brightwellii.AAC.1